MPTLKKFLLIPIFAILCIVTRIDSSYAAGNCGIGSLDPSIVCSSYGFTRLNGNAGNNESNYGLTTGSGEWAAECDYGTVWGMANCNTTDGVSTGAVNNNLQTESSGQYCWCQATGFTASGNAAYTSGPQCTTTASSSWVFLFADRDADGCADNCANYCASRFGSLRYESFRGAVFGAVPQVVDLTWYDGNSTISGPSSCTVGGTFVPPTPAARPGWIFAGWKIKPRTCGIPNLDTSIRPTDISGGELYAYQRDSNCIYGPSSRNTRNYGITTDNTWAVEFSYGTVWGRANCNNTSGPFFAAGTPTLASSGPNCWCQATGFTASGNSYTSGPQCITSASNTWVFTPYSGEVDDCAANCAYYCIENIDEIAAFRSAVFGAVGQ